MNLVYLTANAAYVFVWHEQIVPMGATRFFGSRTEAVRAARVQGLLVARDGSVTPIEAGDRP